MNFFKRVLTICTLLVLPAITMAQGSGQFGGPVQSSGAASNSSSTVLDAFSLGVKANWKEFYGTNITVTVTSGSAAVTCTGCFANTGTNGGMPVVATNAGGTIASDTNYMTSVSLFPAGTTILSVQSANAATMTANATGSCSGSTGPSCIFAFGTNDDAAWNMVNTTFQALNTCPIVVAPAGITNWDTVNKFNTAPLSCTPAVQGNTATLTNSGPMFRGQGPSSTKIILTPTYLAAVVAGTCSTTCAFNIPNMIVKDAGWTGYGQSNAGQTTVAKLFGGGTGSYYENVSLSGFMGGDLSINNVGVALNYASGMNFKEDGFGGNGVVCSSYCWLNGNSYVLDNFRTNVTCGGFCYTFGVGYGTGATFVNGGTDYICTSGSHCYSENDNITYENTTNSHQIYQNAGGTLYITGMHMLAAATNTTGLYAPNASSIFHIRDSEITGGATANAILVTGGSTVKFLDECGNTITGPVTFSTSLFVPCSQTAYTVTLPQVGATGTGACATITTQTGNIFNGSLKCTGTTGASTIVLTPGITAQNGWNCKDAQDITTTANTFVQTGVSTGTCTLTGTVNANDVVVFTLAQY